MPKMTHTKRIASLKRLTNSKSGNPRYFVTFTDSTVARTAPDAACNYGIENPEFQDRDILVTFEDGLITYINQIGE